jgi:hypothetical protein
LDRIEFLKQWAIENNMIDKPQTWLNHTKH